MKNTLKIDEGLRQQYIQNARTKQTGSGRRPAWVGQFWNDENMPQAMFRVPEKESAARSTCLVQIVRSAPYDEVIERAVAFRPGARDILEKWKLAWERSFPGFNCDPAWNHEKVGQSYVGWTISRLNWHFDRGEKGLEVKPGRGLSNEALSLSEKATFFKEVEYVASHAKDDPRDSRLHIIDDADTVLSCAAAVPGGVILVHNGIGYKYTGNDSDGLPKFIDIGRTSQWMENRLNDHPEYWYWPAFIKYMKRRSIFAADRRTAAAIIADMAWQGETHAFIKGGSSKSGTWTVHLDGIRTFEDADAKLTMLKASDASIVQEQLPFTHEQRFYIYNGKLMTSACSDRNFSRIDCREGKRLDDRLAVLEVPSINQGAFDRGITSHVIDRKTSAAFAREVRKIAAELKPLGILNYVVDMGLTERGITAVEINTLHYAGPYCMDHRWQIRSYATARRALLSHVRECIIAAATSRANNDPEILARIPLFVTDVVCNAMLEDEVKAPLIRARKEEDGICKGYEGDAECLNAAVTAVLTKALLHKLASAELDKAA